MDSFEDRNRQDYEYWRQSKFIRGESSDVYAIDGLVIISIVVLAILAFLVTRFFNTIGVEKPGRFPGFVAIGIFLSLFGKIIHRVVSQTKP